jgi:hypothetical protein
VIVDASRIASLREQGRSWSQITAEMRIGKGTAQRAIVASQSALNLHHWDC